MRFPACDLAPHVSNFCLKEWQDIWDANQGNKLYAIYPNVGGYQCKSSLSRRDAVLINRLVLVILDLHTLIYCQGMFNQYVLLVSPRSLLSTFSLNVLILLLSVAVILVLLQ